MPWSFPVLTFLRTILHRSSGDDGLGVAYPTIDDHVVYKKKAHSVGNMVTIQPGGKVHFRMKYPATFIIQYGGTQQTGDFPGGAPGDYTGALYGLQGSRTRHEVGEEFDIKLPIEGYITSMTVMQEVVK